MKNENGLYFSEWENNTHLLQKENIQIKSSTIKKWKEALPVLGASCQRTLLAESCPKALFPCSVTVSPRGMISTCRTRLNVTEPTGDARENTAGQVQRTASAHRYWEDTTCSPGSRTTDCGRSPRVPFTPASLVSNAGIHLGNTELVSTHSAQTLISSVQCVVFPIAADAPRCLPCVVDVSWHLSYVILFYFAPPTLDEKMEAPPLLPVFLIQVSTWLSSTGHKPQDSSLEMRYQLVSTVDMCGCAAQMS